jgi:hypothetical protein
MIQLATDPAASRVNWRADQAKGNAQGRPGKPAHAWPFISRHAGSKPAAQGPSRKPGSDHGS